MYRRLTILAVAGFLLCCPVSRALAALDTTVVDLLYDPSNGNVQLSTFDHGVSVDDKGMLGFVLKNAVGGTDFNAGVVTFPSGSFAATDIATEISWADTTPFGQNRQHDLGNIFPTSLSLAQLNTFLTTANYSPGLGLPVTDFDLILIPEPSAFLLLGVICCGFSACYGWRMWRANVIPTSTK